MQDFRFLWSTAVLSSAFLTSFFLSSTFPVSSLYSASPSTSDPSSYILLRMIFFFIDPLLYLPLHAILPLSSSLYLVFWFSSSISSFFPHIRSNTSSSHSFSTTAATMIIPLLPLLLLSPDNTIHNPDIYHSKTTKFQFQLKVTYTRISLPSVQHLPTLKLRRSQQIPKRKARSSYYGEMAQKRRVLKTSQRWVSMQVKERRRRRKIEKKREEERKKEKRKRKKVKERKVREN